MAVVPRDRSSATTRSRTWARRAGGRGPRGPGTPPPGRVPGSAPRGPPGTRRGRVGYWIAAPHRRRGYTTGGLDAISRWGLTLDGIERLELYVEPWNEGSWRAAERAGYHREGLLRRWQYVGPERRDMYMYSLF